MRIIPLDVPSTMEAETARHVGEPKFLFPASEKACPFSLCSFVHRTTSHGGEVVSVSAASSNSWLLREAFRLWPPGNAGDEGLGDSKLGDAMRDWNLRSNGRNDGVGLLKPRLEATEGSTLLPTDDITEPCRHEISLLLLLLAETSHASSGNLLEQKATPPRT